MQNFSEFDRTIHEIQIISQTEHVHNCTKQVLERPLFSSQRRYDNYKYPITLSRIFKNSEESVIEKGVFEFP